MVMNPSFVILTAKTLSWSFFSAQPQRYIIQRKLVLIHDMRSKLKSGPPNLQTHLEYINPQFLPNPDFAICCPPMRSVEVDWPKLIRQNKDSDSGISKSPNTKATDVWSLPLVLNCILCYSRFVGLINNNCIFVKLWNDVFPLSRPHLHLASVTFCPPHLIALTRTVNSIRSRHCVNTNIWSLFVLLPATVPVYVDLFCKENMVTPRIATCTTTL